MEYRPQDGWIVCHDTGSIIFLFDLAYQPSDPEYSRLGGLELTGAFVDEANEIDDKARNILLSRICKDHAKYDLVPKVLYTCNPSKNWTYHTFYLPWQDGTLAIHRSFLPALVGDNPHISDIYREQLSMIDPLSRERLLMGNWEYDDDPLQLFVHEALQRMWTHNSNEENHERMNQYLSVDIARFGRDFSVVFHWR
jgi:phage terminase large subunit